jgi:hypothetical protein
MVVNTDTQVLSQEKNRQFIDEMPPVEQRLFALEMRIACLEMQIDKYVQILEKVLEVLESWNNATE